MCVITSAATGAAGWKNQKKIGHRHRVTRPHPGPALPWISPRPSVASFSERSESHPFLGCSCPTWEKKEPPAGRRLSSRGEASSGWASLEPKRFVQLVCICHVQVTLGCSCKPKTFRFRLVQDKLSSVCLTDTQSDESHIRINDMNCS